MPLRKAVVTNDVAIKTVEQEIRDLAAEHGITAERNGIDVYAEVITSLADDDVQLDEVEQLLVNLGRAERIDGIEMNRLLLNYFDERKLK